MRRLRLAVLVFSGVLAVSLQSCGGSSSGGGGDTPVATATVTDPTKELAVTIDKGEMAGTTLNIPANSLPAGTLAIMSVLGSPPTELGSSATGGIKSASAALEIKFTDKSGQPVELKNSAQLAVPYGLALDVSLLGEVPAKAENMGCLQKTSKNALKLFRKRSVSVDTGKKTVSISINEGGAFLLVLVGDEVLSGFEEQGDNYAPAAANSVIVLSGATPAGIDVSWSAAVDNVTTAANLEYKLVYSTSQNIATAATAEASGTTVLNWTKATLSAEMGGLEASTTYYVNVLVRDEVGLVASYTMNSAATLAVPTPNVKRIFLTNAVYSGNLGNVAGADSKCSADTGKPTGASIWKALLVDTSTRVACTSANCITSGVSEHVDWVLLPSTAYYQVNSTTLIGTTNAVGIFDFSASALSSAFTVNAVPGRAPLGDTYWTGFGSYKDWTKTDPSLEAALYCNNWTSDSNGQFGPAGEAGVASTALRNSKPSCDMTNRLVCVEQ